MIQFDVRLPGRLSPNAWQVSVSAYFVPGDGDLLHSLHDVFADQMVEREDGSLLGMEISKVSGTIIKGIRNSDPEHLARAVSRRSDLSACPETTRISKLVEKWARGSGSNILNESRVQFGSVFMASDFSIDPHVVSASILGHMVSHLEPLSSGGMLVFHEGTQKSRDAVTLQTIYRSANILGSVCEQTGVKLLCVDTGTMDPPRYVIENPSDPCFRAVKSGQGALFAMAIPEDGAAGLKTRIEGEALAGVIEVSDWLDARVSFLNETAVHPDISGETGMSFG